jgi:hypothetical protein
MLTMPLTNYPRVYLEPYSSTQGIFTNQERFEKTYITDAYAMSPDDSLSTFFDSDSFFNQTLATSEKTNSNFLSDSYPFDPTLPTAGIAYPSGQQEYSPDLDNKTTGQVDHHAPDSTLDPAAVLSAEPASFSPTSHSSSRTPSLCGDAPRPAQSPSMSPCSIKRESPSPPASPREQTTSKRSLRKRGRPRLDRFDMEFPLAEPSSKCPRTGRLPHNQVERKYREGLNSELERLRKTVPRLSHGDEAGQPKPSKGMILSSAIEYIKTIENERDALREEVARLKQRQPQPMGWPGDNTSLDDFLLDFK